MTAPEKEKQSEGSETRGRRRRGRDQCVTRELRISQALISAVFSQHLTEVLRRGKAPHTRVPRCTDAVNKRRLKETSVGKILARMTEAGRSCFTYCTTVEMCRRRMPGVGNCREFM